MLVVHSTLLWIWLCVATPSRPAYVDIFEDNVVVNADGSTALHQIILWRWEQHNGLTDYYVVAWDYVNRCHGPEPLCGRWIGRVRGKPVSARLYRQTIYNVDIEVLDRKRLPESKRSLQWR